MLSRQKQCPVRKGKFGKMYRSRNLSLDDFVNTDDFLYNPINRSKQSRSNFVAGDQDQIYDGEARPRAMAAGKTGRASSAAGGSTVPRLAGGGRRRSRTPEGGGRCCRYLSAYLPMAQNPRGHPRRRAPNPVSTPSKVCSRREPRLRP